jgi:hypothetical protein
MTTYTAREVAAQWRCSVYKVAKTARAAGVGVQLAGRAGWRFTQADVDAMVAHLRPAPVAPVRRRRRRAA